MPLQVAPFLILALAAAIIGYGVWYQAQNPPRVVATGTFEVWCLAVAWRQFNLPHIRTAMPRAARWRLAWRIEYVPKWKMLAARTALAWPIVMPSAR